MALPRAIVELDDFVEPKNIMIYGDTGSGKTILASQLKGRILVISSEGGMTVIKRFLAKHDQAALDDKRFQVWPVRSWADLEDCYLWVRDNPDEFDWIVIDSATSLQNRAMRAAMDKAVRTSPEKRDIDLPDRGEHQKMQNAMKRMVTDFNELPVNTMWLAQSMYREDKDGNEIVLPFIMGKDYEVSSFVCANMHAFGVYRKRPAQVKGKDGKVRSVTERVLQFDSFTDSKDVNYWAKDRYQVLPKSVVMARGERQLANFGELMATLDDEPHAIARAKVRVEERDDAAEPETAPAPVKLAAVPDPEPEPEETPPEAKEDPTPEPATEPTAEAADDPTTWSQEPADPTWQPTSLNARKDELLAGGKKAIAAAATAAGMELSELKGKTPDEAAAVVAVREAIPVTAPDAPLPDDELAAWRAHETQDPEPTPAPAQDDKPRRFVADDDEEN